MEVNTNPPQPSAIPQSKVDDFEHAVVLRVFAAVRAKSDDDQGLARAADFASACKASLLAAIAAAEKRATERAAEVCDEEADRHRDIGNGFAGLNASAYKAEQELSHVFRGIAEKIRKNTEPPRQPIT